MAHGREHCSKWQETSQSRRPHSLRDFQNGTPPRAEMASAHKTKPDPDLSTRYTKPRYSLLPSQEKGRFLPKHGRWISLSIERAENRARSQSPARGSVQLRSWKRT